MFGFFILAPPLLGCLINSFRFKSINKKLSAYVAILACLLPFIATVVYCYLYGFKTYNFFVAPWLQLENLNLNISFTLDALSLLFCLLITGVASLIHVYSFSYMFKELAFTQYFMYLNLFVFMMLVLVLADNLLLLFVGWEGVGLCSYLLIGFWFKDKKNTQAGQQAFIVNRIGDASFLLGLFVLFYHFKTLNFSELNLLFSTTDLNSPKVYLAALFLFLGATGKSAQWPLYFWLPKAMAGPTPVSALIHAATMVTAGIYLIVRLNLFYQAFPDLLLFIAWIGALTCLGSALIASNQWDFKKILAYSTISQLAYLFMAVGVGAYSTSVFHLITHGFFKALLFLCAGSCIHALRGEQDIRFMGGLRRAMPVTFITYLAGALALIAMPPFSGFFSKEEILWVLFSSQNYALFAVAFITGLCTVFYMTKLTVHVFFGDNQAKQEVKESPLLMLVPLVILAILSTFSGILGLPHFLQNILPKELPHFLQNILQDFSPTVFKSSTLAESLIMLCSSLAGLMVLLATSFYYLKNSKSKIKVFPKMSFLEKDFFIQDHIDNTIKPFFLKFTNHLFKHVEEGGIFQIFVYLEKGIYKLKKLLSRLQNGDLSLYAFAISFGLLFFFILTFLR